MTVKEFASRYCDMNIPIQRAIRNDCVNDIIRIKNNKTMSEDDKRCVINRKRQIIHKADGAIEMLEAMRLCGMAN